MNDADDRKYAWICTGCLAAWIFGTEVEGNAAEEASRRHACAIEGATTVLVDASSVPKLTEMFGSKRTIH